MKLSIITINYNNAEGLRLTMQSVLSLHIPVEHEIEYIIIDGASTDGSVDVIKELVQQRSDSVFSGEAVLHLPMQIHWQSEPDSGIYNAMNKGIRIATGGYCIFMNSGDCFAHKNVLREIMQMALNADIVCGDSEGVQESGVKRIIKAPQLFALRHVMKGVPHQAEFIKTNLLKQYGGYDESFRILADVDFNIWACLHDATYQRLDVLVSIVDLTGVSCDNTNYEAMKQEGERIQRKYLPKRVWDDYEYFTDKKSLGNPAIQWLIHTQWLFRMIKGVYYKLVRK